MSQVTYEIIRKLFEIYPIILQIVLFLVLWNVFFRWEKGIWIVAGILAVMNICMGLWLEKPGVIRYTMSAVIVLGYCFCKYQKHFASADCKGTGAAPNDRGAAIEINNIKLSSEGCLYEAVPRKQTGRETTCFAKLYVWQ